MVLLLSIKDAYFFVLIASHFLKKIQSDNKISLEKMGHELGVRIAEDLFSIFNIHKPRNIEQVVELLENVCFKHSN